MNKTLEEPKGIGFFNIKSGDTHYCKLEPAVAAYINSSDMGINASRDQDFGWRLEPMWVKRVKAFRRDAMRMSLLTQRNGGQRPTTVQILYYLYSEDLRAYREQTQEHETPFEGEYQRAISDEPKAVAEPTAEAVPEDVADEDLAPAEDAEKSAPKAKPTPKK